ncbi:sulfotransferase family protein [Amaricoccus solimangrovi]|uniref:Sulfotransferase domain-containing protein n=1 Tax=Amaricoccus solimangrovi TaxID=2589815 RepID=A0A501WN58_9RHOB|nr:sulfotransferase [Amaricoccus solimangrovi]TPE48411.1 sulfotransferase domain-containing protein [Amaricoccus solimangrovi]
MTLPNFLIIGAPKAGTTSLYDYMREHPQIFMSDPKETRFFAYRGQGGDRTRWPVQSLEEYEALFAPVRDEIAIGEATPHYLIYPHVAERIHDLLPEARLIASLRNPVDRSYSVYQMNLRNQGTNTGLPYAEAIRSDHNLRETYADKLERYFALFPRERIRIILLEDLEGRPEAVMRGLFEFLGVDPAFRPDLSRISNPGGEPRIKLLHDLLAHPGLRDFGRKFLPRDAVEKLKDLRGRNLRKQPMSAADRKAALAIFREDILATGTLIGRDLTHWLR